MCQLKKMLKLPHQNANVNDSNDETIAKDCHTAYS